MNIDLLRTRSGEFGLVCDQVFQQTPKAALFDVGQGIISLEFDHDSEALVCNVAVVEEWRLSLSLEDYILLGTVQSSVVHAAERIPLKPLS